MDSQVFCTPCQHTIRDALVPSHTEDSEDSEVDKLGLNIRAHDKMTKAGFERSGIKGAAIKFDHRLQNYMTGPATVSDSDESSYPDEALVRASPNVCIHVKTIITVCSHPRWP